MKFKQTVQGILVVLIIAGAAAGFWNYQKNKNRTALASRIVEMGTRGGGPPATIEGLRSAIAAYENQIEQHVKDAAQAGVYWKILAVRLQDRGLHLEALDALERALSYYPEDPALQYMIGVSSGYAAKSAQDFPGREQNLRDRYFALCESAYLRAIALDDRYLRPRFGVAVLYLFELNRPTEAVPHLQKYLEISTRDVDAMFLLARAYYMTGQTEEALRLYERIVSLTKDPKKKEDAENNRQLIMGRLYG